MLRQILLGQCQILNRDDSSPRLQLQNTINENKLHVSSARPINDCRVILSWVLSQRHAPQDCRVEGVQRVREYNRPLWDHQPRTHPTVRLVQAVQALPSDFRLYITSVPSYQSPPSGTTGTLMCAAKHCTILINYVFISRLSGRAELVARFFQACILAGHISQYRRGEAR
jgi:hypothetical protein